MPGRTARGFTLLEMLVAMTLMSVILVLLYSGMRFGARSWEVSATRAEITSELRLVQDFMRRQWRQSSTVFYNDDGERLVAFHGKADELQLVTPMLAHLGFGGLYWVQYTLADDGGSQALQLRWWPYQPDGEDRADDPAGESVLLRGVNDLQFSYFGAEELEDDPQWHSRWESTRQRPRLIRIELSWERADWPPLVVGMASY